MTAKDWFQIIFGLSGWITFTVSHFRSKHLNSRLLANEFRRNLQNEKAQFLSQLNQLKTVAKSNSTTLSNSEQMLADTIFQSFIKMSNECELASEAIQDRDISKKHQDAIIPELSQLYDCHTLAYSLFVLLKNKKSFSLPDFDNKSFSAFYQTIDENVTHEECKKLHLKRKALGLPLKSNGKTI